MLACHIGIIHDIQGPSNTITCAEASAHLAIGEAAQVIARGNADIALAGGAEAKINLMVMVRQNLLEAGGAEPQRHARDACRPFDADAAGSVFGEGGGVIVLETLDHARSRSAKILAEVAGIGQSHSIHPAYEKMEPDGTGIRIAVEKAMADAGIGPEDLDLIVPHGTGVPHDDLAEARGLEAALGPAVRRIPVWPTKSMLSTTGAAAGAIGCHCGGAGHERSAHPAGEELHEAGRRMQSEHSDGATRRQDPPRSVLQSHLRRADRRGGAEGF